MPSQHHFVDLTVAWQTGQDPRARITLTYSYETDEGRHRIVPLVWHSGPVLDEPRYWEILNCLEQRAANLLRKEFLYQPELPFP